MLLTNSTFPLALALALASQLLVELVLQPAEVEHVVTPVPIVFSCISEVWLMDKTGERTALDVARGDPTLKLCTFALSWAKASQNAL